MLQNGQTALDFLRYKKIKLVNIRAEDIVDGNPKLTLGLIWTIILHFQVSRHFFFEFSFSFYCDWCKKTYKFILALFFFKKTKKSNFKKFHIFLLHTFVSPVESTGKFFSRFQ